MTIDEQLELMRADIGRPCYILESCFDWESRWNRNKTIRNVVLTYVLLPNTHSQQAYIPSYVVNTDEGWSWNIHPECIKFTDKPVKPVKLYTSTCSVCHSPSRKSFCSNVKCKSWKKLRKMAAQVKYEQGLTPEDPIVVSCHSCGKLAFLIGFEQVLRSGIVGTNVGDAYNCSNSHCSYYGWNAYEFAVGHWYKYGSGTVEVINFNDMRVWGKCIKPAH